MSGIYTQELLGHQEPLSKKTQIQIFPLLEKHRGFLSIWGLGMRLAFISVTSGQVHLSCTVSAGGFHIFCQAMADITGYEIKGH